MQEDTPTLEQPEPWEDCLLAARLLAINPNGLKGLIVKAKAGPVRDVFLSYFQGLLKKDVPFRKMPANITDDRLIGGVDLAETLYLGKPVLRHGLMSEVNGGVLVIPMAERLSLDAASRLSTALDFGKIAIERDGISSTSHSRFAVLALDEGDGADEALLPSLTDRLGLQIDLEHFSIRDVYETMDGWEELEEAKNLLPKVQLADEFIETFNVLALKFGIFSLRAVSLAMQAARAHAALNERLSIVEEDILVAMRLVLLHRALIIPLDEMPEAEVDEREPQTPEDSCDEASDDGKVSELSERVLEAVEAQLPADLLALLANSVNQRRSGAGGRTGEHSVSFERGRPLASRRGDLRAGRRLDVLSTIRAAAPWQRVRKQERERPDTDTINLDVRRDDFHVARYKEKAETATIFAVDASGSTAASRLGEAKGAVELLLSESYARRDHVALVSFRGQAAELLLSPTRSLVRAKKALAALPGGGGTPLASALQTSMAMVEDAERRGRTSTFVLLTDGSANITLDGQAGRTTAIEEAMMIAKQFGAMQTKTLVVDISKRQNTRAKEIANALQGLYVPLPHVNAQALSNVVRSFQ